VISFAIFGPVAREFLEVRKTGGMLATNPTVAAIAGLVAAEEAMLETAPADESRPQLQLAVTPSSWRVGGRPRIRQIGGYPKW
jgi:hypothetical protein